MRGGRGLQVAARQASPGCPIVNGATGTGVTNRDLLDALSAALGQGGRMASYDLLTGQRIWELNLAGISTPAVGGDWVFTLTDDAYIVGNDVEVTLHRL